MREKSICVSTPQLSRRAVVVSWTCQIVAATILFQTLFFKFTGAPESKLIFAALGLEPAGRIGAGLVELITAVLLLMPRTAAVGAALAVATISGALFAHATKLGVVVQD